MQVLTQVSEGKFQVTRQFAAPMPIKCASRHLTLVLSLAFPNHGKRLPVPLEGHEWHWSRAGLFSCNANTASYCAGPVALVEKDAGARLTVRQIESETAHIAPAMAKQMALPVQLKCS